MSKLIGKVALVTGASRGIGARVAVQLGEAGADVVINYRSKQARAEEVAAQVREVGRRAIIVQADLTDMAQLRAMMQQVSDEFGRLDLLVLNASGGLEKEQEPGYAMRLNVDGQVGAVQLALPLMVAGSRIVYVTSHLAHFYGTKPIYPGYEAVAESKQAGERALLTMRPELQAHGVRLVMVSGDLIEGTITPKLMQRYRPGLIEARREQAGGLPTVDEFAAAIVAAAANDALQDGEMVFVGSTEWAL